MTARALLWAVLLAGCGSPLPSPRFTDHTGETPQVVTEPPPPGKVEIVPKRPPALEHPVWIDGEYLWTGRGWVWKDNGWQEDRPGEAYAQPLTRRVPEGQIVHFPGTWRKKTPPSP